MPDSKPRISLSNITDHQPLFEVDPAALPESAMWKVFDEAAFGAAHSKELVSLDRVISRKDQSKDPKFMRREKPDPRETAYRFMVANVNGENLPRAPISVTAQEDGTFEVVDGNATAQVIMLAGWNTIPCVIVDSHTSHD